MRGSYLLHEICCFDFFFLFCLTMYFFVFTVNVPCVLKVSSTIFKDCFHTFSLSSSQTLKKKKSEISFTLEGKMTEHAVLLAHTGFVYMQQQSS